MLDILLYICLSYVREVSCQLPFASCQFNVELATGSQLHTLDANSVWFWTFIELATVNWQLAANSIFIKNFELATVNCQPAANSKELP